jgi:hypothetical protein
LTGVAGRFSPELGERGNHVVDARAGDVGGVLSAGARGASAAAEAPTADAGCMPAAEAARSSLDEPNAGARRLPRQALCVAASGAQKAR